jgi:HAMP domain-containing protein
MNANELADAIEKGGKDGFFQDEIVAILRQQQAEIEALNQRIERMIEKQSHYEAMAHAGGFETGKRQQQSEIEALKAMVARLTIENGEEI